MSGATLRNLLDTARTAQQRGDTAAAERAYRAMLDADPGNAQAANSLGIIAMDRGDLAEAEALFLKAVAADPKESALWMNVAKARRLKGDDEGERQSLESALALDQRNFMALLRKAELHERLGEPGGAVAAWRAVMALAAQAESIPAALKERIDHARNYVAGQVAAFDMHLEAALEPARDGLSGSELRRFNACVDVMLGKRQIFANECHGVHFPFLPADEYFDRAHFPWLGALEARTDVIREELRALVDSGHEGFRPYVSQDSGTPENKWTPLDKSLDWSALFLWEYGVRNDDACGRCPQTAAALAAVPQSHIPSRAPTAFFSLLKPHSHIPPHTGVTNLRTIIHLPLIVPEGCRFRVGGETRPWREGEAFAFDDTIDHEAWNDSDDLRAVLIFDVWNPYLTEAERRLMCLLFEVSDASVLNPAGGKAG